MTVSELPLLAGWPLGDLRDLPVQRVKSRQLPAHPEMPVYDPETRGTQRLVAVGRRGGRERALVFSPEAGRSHAWLVGPTGSGKTTILLRLIKADMAAGRSVVVFDPKDLVNDVLARVPAERRQDVVVLDPSSDRPVGFNPLAAAGRPAELVADGIFGILHELFAAHWGPRTGDVLHSSLLTLARTSGTSLPLLPVLLTNPAYRQRLVAGLNDPLGVSAFWRWYDALSEAERAVVIAPTLSRLRQLLLRPSLRSVLGQTTPAFHMGEVFKRPRIVLVRLSPGQLGPEGAALFGSLVWSQLWQLIQAQAVVPPAHRRTVTVFADEFQIYLRTPVSFTDMLVTSRALGTGLIVAHQHLPQLSTEVREALLANAGSRVVFGLRHDDAKVFARHDYRLEADDFTGLGRYEVYASLRTASGEDTGWMSGRTLPPSEALLDPADLQCDVERRLGQERAETEAALIAAAGLAEPDLGVVGRRPRGGRS